MKHSDRKLADTLYRNHFGAFAYAAFRALYPRMPLVPNWHIDAICYRLEQMVLGASRRRLVLNAPPRSLKSFLVSIAFPAWLLGCSPAAKILGASYAEDLAHKFSRECRALLETRFFKRVFPSTRLNPKKISEEEFETTERGSRLAVSTGGSLTGRGGGVLIVDDPSKADDAFSQLALTAAYDWFRNTALSRLDDPRNSLVIVAMQRLHVDDLSGKLIEQGWPVLSIPAVAYEPVDYAVGPNEFYRRSLGGVLQSDRDSYEIFDDLCRQLGSHVFAAQYQQNPTPPDGNMIKRDWLGRYSGSPDRSNFRRVVLSCDPAGKSGVRNDYTAICVAGIGKDTTCSLLQVTRGHWTIRQMLEVILALATHWKPDVSVIEDTSTGMGLIQLLQEHRVKVVGRRPKDDKETRFARHQARFEVGRVVLPV